MESGFSFAPALRPHQRAQCRNGANGGQQDKAGQEKKSALHVLDRERPHDSSPLRLVPVYHFSCRPQSQCHDSLDVCLGEVKVTSTSRNQTWKSASHIVLRNLRLMHSVNRRHTNVQEVELNYGSPEITSHAVLASRDLRRNKPSS